MGKSKENVTSSELDEESMQ